jgi:hypothetical protein
MKNIKSLGHFSGIPGKLEIKNEDGFLRKVIA